jgi:hypothetical protein
MEAIYYPWHISSRRTALPLYSMGNAYSYADEEDEKASPETGVMVNAMVGVKTVPPPQSPPRAFSAANSTARLVVGALYEANNITNKFLIYTLCTRLG